MTSTGRWPRSLGVCADLIFSRRDGALYANMAFGEYLGALADHADRLVVFGRLDERDRAGHHLVGKLDGRIEFVELPFYESVADLVSVMRARPEVRRRFLEHAHELDGVWIFGPHPVSLTLVAAALEASVPVCLGVRQDQPKYMRSRLTGWRRAVGVPLFLYWERRFRRLAKSLPTAVAGEELRQLYGGGPSVVATAFTLVRAGEVAAAPRVRDLEIDDCLEIITVSRLDREKNPLLLVDIAAELRRLLPERRFRLRIVGDGPMSEQLAARIGEFELADCVELLGYVPYGPQLSALYNSSDIFLHVSHTEGLPQVLIEAMAHGVPLVATAVGGVVALLAGTEAAVVAPGDAVAAAQALTELATDKSLRLAGATAGLQRAAELTIEAQQSAVLAHFASMHDRLLA